MNFSSEMDNKEYNDQLFECSLLLLSLLLKEYKAKLIDIIDFKTHTDTKINYILNNLEIIKDNMQKNSIKNLINECIEINNIP